MKRYILFALLLVALPVEAEEMMSPREAAYRAKALFSEPIDADHRSVGEALYIAEQASQGQPVIVSEYMSAKEAAFRARALFPDTYPAAPQAITAYTPRVYGAPVYGTPLYGSPAYAPPYYAAPTYGAPIYTGQLYGYNPSYGYGQPRDMTEALGLARMATPTPQQVAVILPPQSRTQPEPTPETAQTTPAPTQAEQSATLKLNTDPDTTTTEAVIPNNLTQEQSELVEQLVREHLENDRQKAQDRQEYERVRQVPWLTFLGGLISMLLLLAAGYTVREIILASKEDDEKDTAETRRNTRTHAKKEGKKSRT